MCLAAVRESSFYKRAQPTSQNPIILQVKALSLVCILPKIDLVGPWPSFAKPHLLLYLVHSRV